jgi:hypothetical protein
MHILLTFVRFLSTCDSKAAAAQREVVPRTDRRDRGDDLGLVAAVFIAC